MVEHLGSPYAMRRARFQRNGQGLAGDDMNWRPGHPMECLAAHALGRLNRDDTALKRRRQRPREAPRARSEIQDQLGFRSQMVRRSTHPGAEGLLVESPAGVVNPRHPSLVIDLHRSEHT